ncbi:MAG TPA: hypothetical protein PLT76_10290 [Candidatus Omnitrophota bacterium]|nr:hypothetical protein [Candidatus Omnitrophota bacterium]HQP12574.1 hypothetical protein [Candidatus Omnitrophota bacterium]
MRFLRIFSAVFFAVFLLFCLGLLFFIHARGKFLAEERFSKLFNKPVTIERIHLSWPLRLQVDDLVIPKVFSAKHVSFNMGFLFSSSPQIILSDVILQDAVIYYLSGEKSPASSETENMPGSSPGQEGLSLAPVSSRLSPAWRIWVRNLLLHNGHFFYHRAKSERPFQFEIREMELKAAHVTYPPSAEKMRFDLTGRLVSARLPFSGNLVRLRGWLNYPALDMDAQVTILRQEGEEGVAAQVKSVNNDMTINGKINLGLLGQNLEHKPVDDVSLRDMVMGSLRSSGLELLVDFEIKTKMNDIQFDKMNFSGNLEVKDLFPSGASASP